MAPAITSFERQVLECITADLAQSTMGSKNDPVTWTEVEKWGERIGRTGNAVKGAIGSLVRKKVIWLSYEDGTDSVVGVIVTDQTHSPNSEPDLTLLTPVERRMYGVDDLPDNRPSETYEAIAQKNEALTERNRVLVEALRNLYTEVGKTGWVSCTPKPSERQARIDAMNKAREALNEAEDTNA